MGCGGRGPAGPRPDRAVGGQIEERIDLTREGGSRRPVADDVGERGGPPPELQALVRPPIEEGEAAYDPGLADPGRPAPSG